MYDFKKNYKTNFRIALFIEYITFQLQLDFTIINAQNSLVLWIENKSADLNKVGEVTSTMLQHEIIAEK